MVEGRFVVSPEVGGPKAMVLEEEKVKSPGVLLLLLRAGGAPAAGILLVLRWVMLGELSAFMESERGILEGEGEAAGVTSEIGLVEGEKLTCFLTDGER